MKSLVARDHVRRVSGLSETGACGDALVVAFWIWMDRLGVSLDEHCHWTREQRS